MKKLRICLSILCLFAGTLVISIQGCKKEELATLTTIAVTDITINSGKCGGNISNDGGAEIASRGIVWATYETPSVEQHLGITTDGGGSGLYTSDLKNLSSGTAYYVRAYAVNSAGTAYGNQQTFTTGRLPEVDFTGTPTMGVAPLTVSFTDQSAHNPISWAWDFGDGTSSTQQNPAKTYNTAGSYTVELTTTNPYGSSTHTKTDYIIVGNIPVAAFTGTPTSGTVPLTVGFTDQSTNNPTGWSWEFGDGTISTQQNPTKIYNTVGTYNVSLTAANAFGSNTSIKENYIVAGNLPLANFSGSPTSGTAPLTVSFTDQSTNNPTTWSWDFGDATTSTQPNPSKTYTSAGIYTVRLTVTNNLGANTHNKNDYIVVTEPHTLSGTFVDSRDNITYNSVRIGEQVWMAENLKYLPSVFDWENRDIDGGHVPCHYYYVYEYFGTDVQVAKSTANYQNYGVLYTSTAAMYGACPSGWHLSSVEEWRQLINYVVSQGYPNQEDGSRRAGSALKSCRQVLSELGGTCRTNNHPRWNYSATHSGVDAFGFSALPGGLINHVGLINNAFSQRGISGHWWTYSEYDNYMYIMKFDKSKVYEDYSDAQPTGDVCSGFSVRCVKDAE